MVNDLSLVVTWVWWWDMSWFGQREGRRYHGASECLCQPTPPFFSIAQQNLIHSSLIYALHLFGNLSQSHTPICKQKFFNCHYRLVRNWWTSTVSLVLHICLVVYKLTTPLTLIFYVHILLSIQCHQLLMDFKSDWPLRPKKFKHILKFTLVPSVVNGCWAKTELQRDGDWPNSGRGARISLLSDLRYLPLSQWRPQFTDNTCNIKSMYFIVNSD